MNTSVYANRFWCAHMQYFQSLTYIGEKNWPELKSEHNNMNKKAEIIKKISIM